tara:strand:- start:425 stop:559 length:135 start_codon:yes stop_codon:yes gene_type:complete
MLKKISSDAVNYSSYGASSQTCREKRDLLNLDFDSDYHYHSEYA